MTMSRIQISVELRVASSQIENAAPAMAITELPGSRNAGAGPPCRFKASSVTHVDAKTVRRAMAANVAACANEGISSGNARTARAAALLENGFRTREWKSAFPIARVENYPSDIVGAAFEPDALMLGRFRDCKAPPPPPPEVTASAATVDGKPAVKSDVKKVSAKPAKKTAKRKKRRQPLD